MPSGITGKNIKIDRSNILAHYRVLRDLRKERGRIIEMVMSGSCMLLEIDIPSVSCCFYLSEKEEVDQLIAAFDDKIRQFENSAQ